MKSLDKKCPAVDVRDLSFMTPSGRSFHTLKSNFKAIYINRRRSVLTTALYLTLVHSDAKQERNLSIERFCETHRSNEAKMGSLLSVFRRNALTRKNCKEGKETLRYIHRA